jgi:hypothetical protein
MLQMRETATVTASRITRLSGVKRERRMEAKARSADVAVAAPEAFHLRG